MTINQGASQADPTTVSPIVFDVRFSESVTGFDAADITLSGTAGATNSTVSGSGSSYTVSVSGMTTDGTVIASIAAGAALNASGNFSTASTSNDNSVTFIANQSPMATNDTYSTNENTPLSISAPGVLNNDTDPDTGDTLSAVKVSNPANGTLVFNSNGSFTYIPNPFFNGSDSFTYKANDGTADCNVATVNITVQPVNTAPAFTKGSDVTVAEDSGPYSAPWASNISPGPANESSQTVTFQIIDTSNPGLFSAGPAIDSNGTLTFTPAPNQNGIASIVVAVKDNGGRANGGIDTSISESFTITVTPVNDPPTAVNDSYSTVQNTPMNVAVAQGLLSNDSDPDGSSLSVTAVTTPAHGSLNVNANGSFTYTPAANYNGADSFTYTVSDGTATAQGQVSITVRPPNSSGAQFYAIDNNPDNGTAQLYTIDPVSGVATPLGPRQQLDFEDVAIQPGTGTLYAATGGDGTQKGLVSIVDGQTGILSPLGPSGLPRITALTFKSDGTLWSWVEGQELFQLNPVDGKPLTTKSVYKSNTKIEGMAWAGDGNLYLAVDKKLYQYNPTSKKWKSYAENLPKGTESFSILPDGRLVGGTRSKTTVSLFIYNITTKKVVSTKVLTAAQGFTFSSVEGLVWPSTQQLPQGF